LLNNLRPGKIPADMPDDCFEEFDSCDTVACIRAALLELVAEVVPLCADRTLPGRLSEGGFHFAFNIAEGTGRRCREAVPAAVCELMGIPYSASDPLTLGLTLDKAMARRVVGSEVRVPGAVLVQREADFAALENLCYPVIVKPNDEGSSKGIRDNPIADDPAGARSRCERLLRHYGCPSLVEEFIEGIEVTVGILGNTPQERVLGVMEIEPVTRGARFVYSLEVKRDWRKCVTYHVPPRLDAGTVTMIEETAIRAFRLLGCRDFARIDFRLDRSGTLFFLECNALPGLDPANSDIVFLSANALNYRQLVQGILVEAARREAPSTP